MKFSTATLKESSVGAIGKEKDMLNNLGTDKPISALFAGHGTSVLFITCRLKSYVSSLPLFTCIWK